MDVTTLSQMQFAITSIYHFFFVPLTLGLSVIVAIMETYYVRTGQDVYKRMAKFWGKLFLINFAMGVVTGIVQEFQFGMNWSNYSRIVGDVFGAPLAIEALLAFFLESTFLGLWIFGWGKLSKKLHLATIWLVAIGSNLSALWILIANSFMQSPSGIDPSIDPLVAGKFTLVDFGALIGNSHVWLQFPHTVLSGFTTGALFVIGISAYHLLRKQEIDLFRRSFNIATVMGLVSAVTIVLVGHQQAQEIVRTQPMKMAAAEALVDSEDPASLSLFTIVNQDTLEKVVDIRIPKMLSLLAYNSLNGKVTGMKDLQQNYRARYFDKFGDANYIPNIFVNYWSFRVMVGVGFLMVLILAYALFRVIKKQVTPRMALLRFFPFVIILPYLATTTGWILTEMGRQPWLVFGYLRTVDGVSPNLTSGTVLISLVGFTLVYGVLMVVDIILLTRFAKAGPQPENWTPATATAEEKAFWE